MDIFHIWTSPMTKIVAHRWILGHYINRTLGSAHLHVFQVYAYVLNQSFSRNVYQFGNINAYVTKLTIHVYRFTPDCWWNVFRMWNFIETKLMRKGHIPGVQLKNVTLSYTWVQVLMQNIHTTGLLNILIDFKWASSFNVARVWDSVFMRYSCWKPTDRHMLMRIPLSYHYESIRYSFIYE